MQASGIRVLYTEAGRKMELMEVGAVIASQDLSIIISGKAPVVGRLMIDMNSEAPPLFRRVPLQAADSYS